MSVSGVVLAGGKGSRLGGVNKALLEIGGQTKIQRVLKALRTLSDDLLLVANDQGLRSIPDVRVVLDQDPHAGVLPALAQGLESSQGELVAVVACDMPFLNPQLLAEQIRRAEFSDVVIPVVEGRPEPMHAVYRRAPSLAAIHSALSAGERRMISFLDRLRVDQMQEGDLRTIDPELWSFFNTNTPGYLETARKVAARLGGQRNS